MIDLCPYELNMKEMLGDKRLSILLDTLSCGKSHDIWAVIWEDEDERGFYRGAGVLIGEKWERLPVIDFFDDPDGFVAYSPNIQALRNLAEWVGGDYTIFKNGEIIESRNEQKGDKNDNR